MFSRPPTPDPHRPARRRPLLLALGAVCLFVVGAGPVVDLVANLERLRQMPLAQRRRLDENLRRFDALPAHERQAMIDLDRAINELSDVDRQRYLSVLRRYHVWLRAQDEKARSQLATLGPQQKLRFVEAERAVQRDRRETQRARALPFMDLLQISTLVTESLRVSAIETRLWFLLPPEQRKKVVAAANVRGQRMQLQELVEKDPALQAARAQLVQELGIDVRALRDAAARRIERAKGKNLAKNGPVNQVV